MPINESLSLHKGDFYLFSYSFCHFPDKLFFCVHKIKIRHTSLEIYRIIENDPLESAAIPRSFLINSWHSLADEADDLISDRMCACGDLIDALRVLAE